MENRVFKSETLETMIKVAVKNTVQQHLAILLNRAKAKIERADLLCLGKELVELRDMVTEIEEDIDELIKYYSE